MLSLANLEAMRAGKYLYAGTLTPRIREEEQTRRVACQ